jgi:hypothetical protein
MFDGLKLGKFGETTNSNPSKREHQRANGSLW